MPPKCCPEVEVNKRFPRSLHGGLKLCRMILALVAFICFAAGKSHEAFIALAFTEFFITLLFFLLYLLTLDKTKRFFWPLADIFNSLIAVVFLLIIGLCAVIIKTTLSTLVGGVFCLLLLVVCAIDAVMLYRRITFNQPRTVR
uniref:Chemokine like factor n=1 Tax=Sphenodon punctatus TaxID=8508 RepID=A0A8D0G2A6_SPHPU